MDGLLLDGGAAGLSLATTDLLTLKTTSEAVDGVEASEGNITRLRVGVEATRPFPLPGGAAALPALEVGNRQDSGDAATGCGLEMGGAGLSWKIPSGA